MHDSLNKGKELWKNFLTLTSLVAFNEITLNIWYDGTTQVAHESFRARQINKEGSWSTSFNLLEKENILGRNAVIWSLMDPYRIIIVKSTK